MNTKKRKTPPTSKTSAPKRQKLKATTNLTRQPNTVRGGPEKKNLDGAFVTNPASTGLSITPQFLTPLTQGANSAQRLGRKVKITQLILRWQYSLQLTSVGGSPCRIKVIYDKQSNGAAPGPLDVLIVDNITGLNNLDNSDRFITIMDFITEPISQNNNFAVCGIEKRNIDLEQIWLGGNANGTIAQLQTGAIYLFAWQTGNISTANPVLDFETRVRFIDN